MLLSLGLLTLLFLLHILPNSVLVLRGSVFGGRQGRMGWWPDERKKSGWLVCPFPRMWQQGHLDFRLQDCALAIPAEGVFVTAAHTDWEWRIQRAAGFKTFRVKILQNISGGKAGKGTWPDCCASQSPSARQQYSESSGAGDFLMQRRTLRKLFENEFCFSSREQASIQTKPHCVRFPWVSRWTRARSL
jgi:hypothetical protein